MGNVTETKNTTANNIDAEIADEQIAQAKQQDLLARSYIRYTDANGLLRTYYNDYTGANLHRLAE